MNNINNIYFRCLLKTCIYIKINIITYRIFIDRYIGIIILYKWKKNPKNVNKIEKFTCRNIHKNQFYKLSNALKYR